MAPSSDEGYPTTPPTSIPPSALTTFSPLPIFTQTLNDPTFRSISMSRTVTHDGHGHTLMGQTWNTPTTIPCLLSFYRTRDPDAQDPTNGISTEVRRFYEFGPDLNAHPDLLHGGVISCILDSGLGGAVGIAMGRQPQTLGSGKGMEALTMYTVQLNVRYKAPVRTPGVVVVRAWVDRVEKDGRKVWAKGRVEGAEGLVHAEAEGLWVRGKEAKV
jgi:acyl-coenzyme A thioesterase PaaI-like protein